MPGSPTTPGRADTRDDASIRVAFHENDHVGTRDFQAFAAQWLAYVLPYRRFAYTLADADARLGAGADRYSFTVVDLHHLLLAGFDRRTVILEICTEGRLWVETCHSFHLLERRGCAKSQKPTLVRIASLRSQ